MNTLLIDNRLRQATCAVLIEGSIVGTAWLVSNEGHLLTAGHVLCKERETCDNTYEKVQIKFVDDKTRTASQVLHSFSPKYGIDFAVLQLDDIPKNRQPLPISLARSVPIKSEFRLYGYGNRLTYQATGFGQFLGPHDRLHSSAYRLFSLDSKQLGQSGYSGGAVFSEYYSAVVAVQIEATNARMGAERDTVLAMPLYRVAPFWERLKELAISQEASDDTIAPEAITEVDSSTVVWSTSAPTIIPDSQTIAFTGTFTQFVPEKTVIVDDISKPKPLPLRPTRPPTNLSEKDLSALESCFESHRESILAQCPENKHLSADIRLDALKYAFFSERADLDKVKSVLVFFHAHPAALVKVKKLLGKWVLEKLVRRGDEQMAREYESLVFGRS